MRRLPLVVQGGSETGDERDASSLGIAEGPLLAGVGAIQRPASVLPTAVRAAEAEVIRPRHVSSITTQVGALLVIEKAAVTQERRSSSKSQEMRARPRAPGRS